MPGQIVASLAAVLALTTPLVNAHTVRSRLQSPSEKVHRHASCLEVDDPKHEPWPVLTGPHMECGDNGTPFTEVKCGRMECQRLAESAKADMYAFVGDLCRVCSEGELSRTAEPTWVFRRPNAPGSPQTLLTKFGFQPADVERYDDSTRWNWVRQHHGIVQFIHSRVASNMSSKHLPPLKNLPNRLKNITGAALNNPCQADILAMSPEHAVGLGSRLNSLAEELVVALYGNYTFAVCEKVNNMAFVRDSYLQFFEPSYGGVTLPVCTDPEPCKPLGGEESMLAVSQAGRQLSASLREAKHDYLLEMKQLLYPHIYHYKKNTSKAISRVFREMGITNETRYIGVHIRRGDKVREAIPVATEVYAAAAVAAAKGLAITIDEAKASKTQAITKIFLATDEPSEIGKFKNAIRDDMEVIVQPSRTTVNLQSRDYTDAETMYSLLSDIEALRRSEVFIGTASSNIGTLVSMMRGNRPSISLDMGGDWLGGNQ